ncbi:MAG: hypothetical protein KGZ82_10765 [Bacteroidales bacterium]|nr:hypothetical protein [Bacteroidales bacterium]
MKHTIKEQREMRQAELAHQVCRLLEFDRRRHSALMFEQACAYMENLAVSGEVAQEFLSEPTFWSWWKQQWAIIDEAFIMQARQSPMAADIMRSWYESMHREIDTYPDAIIWQIIHCSYEKMASGLITKKVRAHG